MRRYSGCTISSPERTAPHLAVAAQPRAARQAFALGIGEIKEPQGQRPGAIGQAHQQRAAAAEHDLGQQHLAFDHGAHAGLQRADRHHAGAILVAQRQHEQDVAAAARRPGAPASAPRAPACAGRLPRQRGASGEAQYALHFDPRAARQRGDADRGARRIGLAEIRRHDLVDLGEMRQIGQKHAQLDHAARASRRRPARSP